MHAGMMQPWKPGQSGNPGGRAKLAVTITQLARDRGPEAIEKLVHLMRTSPDERIQYMAAVHLLDRGFGKPKEIPDGSENKPVFTHEEKIEMLQEIARRHGYNLQPSEKNDGKV